MLSKQVMVPINHIGHGPNKNTQEQVKNARAAPAKETNHQAAVLRLEKPAPPAHRRPHRKGSGEEKQEKDDIGGHSQRHGTD